MKATFFYSKEETKRAILDYHSKKITFSTEDYETEVTLPPSPECTIVSVREKIKEVNKLSMLERIFLFLVEGPSKRKET